MKKGICFILFLTTLVSCSEDITFNNSAAFQGVKNNEFWKADDANATVSINALLVIEAVTLNETLTLTMPLPASFISQKDENTYITYLLGTSESKKARYVKVLNDVAYTYQTGTGVGDGEIVVTDYDGATISGTYRFNAANSDNQSTEEPVVNLQSGVFYKVPIVP